MKGGPSHVDTFDYKPLLQRDHGKPLPFTKPRVQFAATGELLKSPWKFQNYGQSGLLVSERVTAVAAEAVDLAVSTDHDVITDYRPYIDQLMLPE